MTADERNIVITGYMGTGKSAVAKLVAQKLRRPSIDMDDVIAERAGKSISDIFAQDGEEVFRGYERVLCRELSQKTGLVVATGGGALVDSDNREVMEASGTVICLDCEAAEILHRLKDDQGRPMLWADDPAQKLLQLLSDRQPAYAAISHHIDTTYRAVEQVMEEILGLIENPSRAWRITTPTGDYVVHLRAAGLEQLGALVRAQGVASGAVVVSDENVWPLYGEGVLRALREAGYQATPVILPVGEQHKTLETVRTLYDRFIDAGLDRSGAVVALGGGVITDMAGFAAATFMRGVGLVQVPTTLLCMVDASVGGKVAVDHPRGKNLVGAFVKPLLVLLDPACLGTLPGTEYRAGLAEIIKAGVIGDATLFESFESADTPLDDRWLIERALQVKIDVVEEDPYEHGRRAVLNLGHTFAHAFEVLANYELHHGLAVSAGMVASAYLAELRGLCSSETRQRIVTALGNHGLPIACEGQDPDVVFDAMRADKKRRGSTLRFILPRAIGDVIIDDGVSRDQVISALERMCK